MLQKKKKNSNPNTTTAKMHLADKTKTQKRARPGWAEPKLDLDGNIKGWVAKPNLLAQQILDDYYMFSAVDQDGKSRFYLYGADDYWEPIDKDGIRQLVSSYFYDDETMHAYDLLTNRVVNDTTGLVTALMNRKKFSETFDKPEQDLDYIPFNYFDYNLIFSRAVPKSPDRYFTYKRDYDIQEEGDAPLTNQWLLESLGNDKEQLKLMKIFIGACFYRSYRPLQFIVFLTGKGEDGKSEFLDFLGRKLVGEQSTSHLSFDQIVRKGTNFSLAELYHKELNTYDDLNASYIDSTMMGTAKQITGGNPFDSEVKNRGNLRFANYASLFFATNEMPQIQNLGYADQRRIFIFNWHQIKDFEKRFPMAEIIKERGAFVRQCLNEFSVILLERSLGKSQSEALPESEAIKANWEQFRLDSDPVARFVAARCETEDDPTKNRSWIVEKHKLYNAFIEWADAHNLKTKDITDRKFNRRIKNLGYSEAVRRVGGINTRVWYNMMLLPNGMENDTDSIIGLKELDF